MENIVRSSVSKIEAWILTSLVGGSQVHIHRGDRPPRGANWLLGGDKNFAPLMGKAQKYSTHTDALSLGAGLCTELEAMGERAWGKGW
jgi:hypothetical protein